MKNTKIIRAIGGIDDELIERAGKKKANKRKIFAPWLKWAAPAAVCLLLAIIAIPFLGSDGNFELPLSSGVKVSHIKKPPNIHVSHSLVYLTEEELFAESYHGYEIVIFEGKVKDVSNIEMNFNGHKTYQAIAEIEVTETIRGNIFAGEVITILLPAPVNMNVWVSDTEVSSQITQGTTGIFMPIRYDETSIISMNDATLFLSEIAGFGMLDGERWAFLETANSLTFARWAYESIAAAKTMDEVRQYIITMTNNN